jgi:hypothetical protein
VVSTAALDAMAKMVLAVPPTLGTFLDPNFARDDDLQDSLDAAVVKSKGAPDASLEDHAFAVVDLTDDPALPAFHAQHPAYAGYRDTEPRSIASLAKILALYGAFRLRADLRQWSIDLPAIGTLQALATNIREEYRRKYAASAVPPRPLIESMFMPAGLPGVVHFTRGMPVGTTPVTDPDLTPVDVAVPLLDPRVLRTTVAAPTARRPNRRSTLLTKPGKLEFELNDLGFREHLRLMAGWSYGVSAAVVIQSLGFPYLWSLAKRTGLFRESWPILTRNDRGSSEPSGLFLGGDYNYGRWNQRPEDAPQAAIHHGTARSLAVLMSMLAQERLIDHEAHAGMFEMLRKTNDDFKSAPSDRSEWSPIGSGMNAAKGWKNRQVAWNEDAAPNPPAADPNQPLGLSKIGWLSGAIMSDAFLVRTVRPTATGALPITAVLIAIANADGATAPLETFGKRMAQKLDERHHVT